MLVLVLVLALGGSGIGSGGAAMAMSISIAMAMQRKFTPLPNVSNNFNFFDEKFRSTFSFIYFILSKL